MSVRPRLIFAGEVQIDIRHLAAAEAQEGFKRDIKAVLYVLCAAHRALLIRHICSAAVAAIQNKLTVFAVRAAVMGRQRIDLSNAGHISHQRGTDGATGAHQIAALIAALHQLLRRHIHHIVFSKNAAQLHVQAVHNQLRRILAVKPMDLLPYQTVQILL